MADSRLTFTIKVDVSAAVASIVRIVYGMHEPRDVEEGSECSMCIEPWPCESLRDFERDHMTPLG